MNIKIDSRKIKQGDTFIAIKELNNDDYVIVFNGEIYNYQSIKDNSTAKTVYNMSLLNIDGNPNGIISKYNDLNSRLKDIFRNELTFITKFNTKLNFNKKYYTHPITIETMEKKQ